MDKLKRFAVAAGFFVFAAMNCQPAWAQENMPVDLSGTWRWISHENWHERVMGPDPGRYWGLPLNDAARMRADTYAEDWIWTSSLLQCRPRGPSYQAHGLDPMQIEKVTDPVTRQTIAYAISFEKTPGLHLIWLDGRPRPSQYAQHTWDGFSTGRFKGDALEVTTTHLKESYVARNGVPASFRNTVISNVYLDEPYLHWTFTVIDPDYLTEPLVRSGTYIRAPTLRLPPYPCQPMEQQPISSGTYAMPQHFVGENPYLTETAVKYKVPIEAIRGGAETMYPEWRAKGVDLPIPPAQFVLKPVYTDDSTKIAERADAQPRSTPTYESVDALHVAGNIYLIAGAGGNIAASIGGDGIILVDSGAAAASEKVLATLKQIAQPLRPPDRPDSASPFASTWNATHSLGEPAIRMVINTSDNEDHISGNGNIRKSPMFKPIGDPIGANQATMQTFAHEMVQRRMVEANASEMIVPTDAYFGEKYMMYRFFNNQAIQIYHMPDAITDGDSAVWFRRSDVIVTGDIFNTDIYPPIDVDRGGSINGVIQALVKIVDMSAVEYMSQGGTMIIPGHGWISDAADVGYYRDMLVVVRDRIQAMIDKGMTLEQVRSVKPTMDYDPLYGRQSGATARFVEAVYRSLKENTPSNQ